MAVVALDPGFESWVSAGLDFEAEDVMVATLLALHICRSVMVFGAVQLPAWAQTPRMYYDTCAAAEEDNTRNSAAAQWEAFRALADAGLIDWGEPCIGECVASEKECQQCRESQGIVPLAKPRCARSDQAAASDADEGATTTRGGA